ncbi:hypothetical protein E2562_029720 [Oryza meyeriana var. granulata]|uniref:Uncharacterized protein n=1 Tax=Oryza meyeriana var. granulata TaxID=110450 RepID=A0A6G1BZQ5_9ORYZ|nr:hypothetical protein E2562_029720 [Oryza meyeriana var. granulata]
MNENKMRCPYVMATGSARERSWQRRRLPAGERGVSGGAWRYEREDPEAAVVGKGGRRRLLARKRGEGSGGWRQGR